MNDKIKIPIIIWRENYLSIEVNVYIKKHISKNNQKEFSTFNFFFCNQDNFISIYPLLDIYYLFI